MYHWIPILNKIDGILEQLSSNATITNEEKHLLITILEFTRILWDNTTNRTIYSSYDHMAKLLGFYDLDIVYLTLKFLVKPAQRIPSQKSLKQQYLPFQALLEIMSHRITPDDFNLQLSGESTIKMQFYRTAGSAKTEMVIDQEFSPSKKPKLDDVVTIHQTLPEGKDSLEFYQDLKREYDVPESKQPELLHLVRVAGLSRNPLDKELLVCVRFLAIAILGSLLAEEASHSKIFAHDPDLLTHLAQLLASDSKANMRMQLCALICIESLAHFRSKLAETLAALNAGANHGIFMQTLRRITQTFEQDTQTLPQDFIECFFALTSYIINTQAGGVMVNAAGITPLLVSAIEFKSVYHMKNVAKCATMIDNNIYGFPSALSAFLNANGIDILVKRIDAEVKQCLELLPQFDKQELAPSLLLDPGVPKVYDLQQRQPLLRACLKLVYHLMQSSGSAEGMRNLIDSILPQTILLIFHHPGLFGHVGAFGLAVNVMSTFIHNEPTSLSILQEAGLPLAFLTACQDELPVSAEVISALPNAFGAICLNAPGLKQFQEQNPLDSYLSNFTKEEHLKSLMDNEVPTLIGNSIDELIRHHPVLKEAVMKSIIKMLEKVVESGKNMKPEPKDRSSLWLSSEQVVESKEDNSIVNFADVASRFLEGLFQNVTHCVEFVNYGGLDLLLQFIHFPTLPYDFADSAASFSLSYIIRICMETNVQVTVDALVKSLRASIEKLKPITNLTNEGQIFKLIHLEEHKEQELFSALVQFKCYTRICADLFTSQQLSISKGVPGMILFFTKENKDLLMELAILRNALMWEKQLGTRLVPPSWLERKDSVQSLGGTNNQTINSNATTPNVETPQQKTEFSPAETNTKYLTHLLDESVADVNMIFKGVLRVLCAKKITETNSQPTFKIVDQLSRVMLKSLDWPAELNARDVQPLLAQGIVFCSNQLLDEKAIAVLQTFQTVSFTKHDGLARIFSIAESTLEAFSNEDVETQSLKYTIEVIVSLLQTLANRKLIQESMHTQNFGSKLVDRFAPGFNARDCLVKHRYLVLTEIKKLWNSPHLSQFSNRTIVMLVNTLMEIMKADGEAQAPQQRTAEPVTSRIPVPVQPQQPVVADPASVQMLVEMGFSRPAAEQALVRYSNNISLATDYILTEPGAMFATQRPTATLNEQVPPAQPAAEEARDDMSVDPSSTTEQPQEPAPEPVQEPDSPLPPQDATDYRQLLNDLRTSFSETMYAGLMDLIDKLDASLMYSLKELIGLSKEDKVKEAFKQIIQQLQACEDIAQNEAKISLRLRLLALLLSDTVMQEYLADNEELIRFVDRLMKAEQEGQWRSTCFLILEIHIKFVTEPIKQEPDAIEYVKNPRQLCFDVQETLKRSIQMLQKKLDKDELNACLRFLMILTREQKWAEAFIELDGTQALFNTSQIALFSAQHPLTMMILRNCAESQKLLEAWMERDVLAWMQFPRKLTDITAFVKGNSSAALRNPEVFAQVAKNVIKLSKADPSRQLYHIQRQTNPDPSVAAGMYSKVSPVFSKAIQTLVGQLMTFRHLSRNREAAIAQDQSLELLTDKDIHIRRTYILQCLAEIAVAYPLVKQEIINASTKKKTPKKDQIKNSLITHLLNDVLPRPISFDQATPTDENANAESVWSACLLCALCISTEKEDQEQNAELESIRRIVLELVAKCLRETNQAAHLNAQTRYSRFVTLSELCFRLLSKETLVAKRSMLSSPTQDNTALVIARVMIEKGFVSIFSSILSDLDVNHPGSKLVVESVMKPFDVLSKAAVTFGKTDAPPTQTPKSRKKEDATMFDSALQDVHSNDEMTNEISDMYRNSALGVLDPAGEQPDYDEYSDSDLEGEEFSDDEEEEEDEPSEDDDEMEIVVPEPYHGHEHEHSSSEDDVMDEEEEEDDGELEVQDHMEMMWHSEGDDSDMQEMEESEEEQEEGFQERNLFNQDQEDDEDEDEEMDEEDQEMEFFDIEEDEEDEALRVNRRPRYLNRRLVDVGVGNDAVDLRWTQASDNVGHHDFDGFRVLSRPLQSLHAEDDMTVHPMLRDTTANAASAAAPQQQDRRDAHRPPNFLPNLSMSARDAETFQMLQEAIARNLQADPTLRVTLETRTLPGTRQWIDVSQISTRLARPTPPSNNHDAPAAQGDEQMKILHSHSLSFTEDRWRQAVKVIYGHVHQERASYITRLVAGVLMPAYLEEEHKRVEEEKKEAERKLQQEKEEAERKAEEERRKQEEEKAKAPVAEEPVPEPEEPEQVAEPAEPRVMIEINGQMVDLTGTGIDVTFLEALPDDLRQEVINEHMRARQEAQETTAQTSDIPAEFLEALPEEIREEVLRQERLEAERRQRDAVRPAPSGPVSNLLEHFEQTFLRPTNTPSRSQPKKQDPSTPAPKKVHRDSVHILDRQGISSLLRIAYLPEPTATTHMNSILNNLCENSRTRSEILTMVISVLENGKHELAAVDQGLSELTLKTPEKSKIKDEDQLAPSLVAQRSLEILTMLVSSNPSLMSRYFLTVQEDQIKTPKTSKKGKEKQTGLVPAVALIRLLERPSFLENSHLLEQLMVLLSNILRPLALVAKKKFASGESEQEMRLPTIPNQAVQEVVNVLKDGAVSLKTFQSTLQVIQHLCAYPDKKKIITDQLLEAIQQLTNLLLPQVEQLTQQLEKVESLNDIDSQVLVAHTAPSSDQAKLLRILKTIDYMYKAEDREEAKVTEAFTQLRGLYDTLKINDLWQRLGQSMNVIDRKKGLETAATVLLPLIEAYMVVAKPYVTKKKELVRQNSMAEDDTTNFYGFTEQNKKILNTMVRANPSLMNGSFSLLVQNPKVLEFDNKRTYFNQQLHKKDSRDYRQFYINVRRQFVFEDSYHQLQGRGGDEFKHGKLNVRFHEEEGVDAGGVTREWFSALARQMFNPDYALFRPSAADKVTYQPNRTSWVNPDHLSYFKFVGRIIGKAIFDGRLLDAYFTRSFYKCILGIAVDYKDIEAIDPEYHKSLEWILENDPEILDLNFTVEVDDFGKTKVIELIQNGKNTPVTMENRAEYVQLVSEQRLVLAIKDQIKAFLSGFHDVIPRELIKIFNEQELELLISGMPDIDIDDWKNNTEYQNYTQASPQIQWFWRAVRSFSQEERAKLIQFATGTSKVPLEGFAQLQGSSGVQKFQIHKEFGSSSRLPSAHTCFNQVDLPQYDSYEQLRAALLTAINEAGTGFGFA
ncbi:hypothetical protein EDD86DRAFT_199252 [Gorgonomyces haynaldii]|nr:hypothetical protein EDD86DRAFT_199252 [Gorgonomyces haynaldii]